MRGNKNLMHHRFRLESVITLGTCYQTMDCIVVLRAVSREPPGAGPDTDLVHRFLRLEFAVALGAFILAMVCLTVLKGCMRA
jgi:hypothetical protein